VSKNISGPVSSLCADCGIMVSRVGRLFSVFGLLGAPIELLSLFIRRRIEPVILAKFIDIVEP